MNDVYIEKSKGKRYLIINKKRYLLDTKKKTDRIVTIINNIIIQKKRKSGGKTVKPKTILNGLGRELVSVVNV